MIALPKRHISAMSESSPCLCESTFVDTGEWCICVLLPLWLACPSNLRKDGDETHEGMEIRIGIGMGKQPRYEYFYPSLEEYNGDCTDEGVEKRLGVSEER